MTFTEIARHTPFKVAGFLALCESAEDFHGMLNIDGRIFGFNRFIGLFIEFKVSE